MPLSPVCCTIVSQNKSLSCNNTLTHGYHSSLSSQHIPFRHILLDIFHTTHTSRNTQFTSTIYDKNETVKRYLSIASYSLITVDKYILWWELWRCCVWLIIIEVPVAVFIRSPSHIMMTWRIISGWHGVIMYPLLFTKVGWYWTICCYDGAVVATILPILSSSANDDGLLGRMRMRREWSTVSVLTNCFHRLCSNLNTIAKIKKCGAF